MPSDLGECLESGGQAPLKMRTHTVTGFGQGFEQAPGKWRASSSQKFTLTHPAFDDIGRDLAERGVS